MNKVNDLLRKKFRATSHTTVKDWRGETKCPLTLESCTAILLRDKQPSLVTALTLGALLGLTNEELIYICKELGDTVLWRRFIASDVTDEEKKLVEKLRTLDRQKMKLVADMVNQLGG